MWIVMIFLPFLIPILFYLCGLIAESGFGTAPFESSFEPITDQEFLKRCGPGTNPDVALRVRAIVSDQLSIEAAQIYPEHRFIEDLRAD